ncbi:MAG TPA: EAL domain-containing protein [Chloroflexota bacterium]|nr:EAL domain-containing protein [Chloroflexota bacterium]
MDGSRGIWLWRVLLTLLVAGVVAWALGVGVLLQAQARQNRAGLLLAQLDVLAGQVEVLSAAAAAEHGLSADRQQELSELGASMRQLVDQFAQVNTDAHRSQQVRRAADDYLAIRREWSQLKMAKSADGVELWEQEHAVPAYRRLLDATAGESTPDEMDGLVALPTSALAIVPTLLVLLLLVCLARRLERSREAIQLLRARMGALGRSEQRFRSLVSNARDLIVIVDVDGAIRFCSPSVGRVLGHAPVGWGSSDLFGHVHPEDVPQARGLIAQTLGAPAAATRSSELRLRHADGSWRHFEVLLTNLSADPAVGGVLGTFHDISERKAFESELRHQAFYDGLTGLPNRTRLLDLLEQALRRAHRQRQPVAVLFLDLDNFKVVNDSLGHKAGDLLLGHVARRLESALRGSDTAARLGGDEFILLLEGLNGPGDARAVADRVAQVLRAPFLVEGREVFVTASMGIALSRDGEDPESLVRTADLAMYQAKSSGKAGYAVFEPQMHVRARRRLEIETDLRHALDRGELRVCYQPIVRLESGGIEEVEALVRWQHPQRGLVPPSEFIPIAEETGLIVPLGRWVLDQVCRQARAWQAAGGSAAHLTVSVNLSARQFQDPQLVQDVATILREADLPPSELKLEITESAAMLEAEATEKVLRALKALGVQLAIDDFGTGYSSLAYLKRFPVDTLKIDRSFVARLGEDPQDTAIVRSVVALAQALGLSVTAEGVETPVQQAQLRLLGCDYGQGYLFSRPLAADELEHLLGAVRPLRPPRAA